MSIALFLNAFQTFVGFGIFSLGSIVIFNITGLLKYAVILVAITVAAITSYALPQKTSEGLAMTLSYLGIFLLAMNSVPNIIQKLKLQPSKGLLLFLLATLVPLLILSYVFMAGTYRAIED